MFGLLVLALAVYSRSPSAFEAVKHLGILQLPSTASLQAFMSHHQKSPGANEQQMALQHELYNQHIEKITALCRMPPKKEGILIFDEVKVQGKVIWNSKNNQILGIAMASDELSSLQDLFCGLDEEEKIRKTSYILQFVWRHGTSKFDVVGPYYTSEKGFDANFTMACVHDAMHLFAAYNFNILALIGDGASWNMSLFKNLCGHKGKFGSDTSSAMFAHDVTASFINPYTGFRVWCIICPSHEVQLFHVHVQYYVCIHVHMYNTTFVYMYTCTIYYVCALNLLTHTLICCCCLLLVEEFGLKSLQFWRWEN